MMHLRCGILLLAAGACLAGQTGAGVRRNLAVTLSGEGDDQTIHLRNEYSSPATAWVLQCETTQGGSRYYWLDQELSFQSKPLGPGQEIEFKYPSPPQQMQQQMAGNGTCTDFHPVAAVFADGTVSGEFGWLNAVASNRRQAYQDIAKAREILNAAISKETATPAVVQEVTDWGRNATPVAIPVRPSAIQGASWGYQSRGTAAPRMQFFRTPVPGAALWLLDKEAMKLPDAVKALAEWSSRLAGFPTVGETAGPLPAAGGRLTTGPITFPSEPEMLGKPAPEFRLKDIDGRETTLASLRGKTVLLDFWATWCAPCRESMPHVQMLSEQFQAQGLVVLGIDTNEPAELARKYFAEQNFSFANLLGSGSDVVKNYGANSIPRVVLIDKDGVVRYTHTGWGSGMDLSAEVKKLIER